MNRLADSASPYLLQHAANPVDWWPWGADAFAEASRRDVPVFISIGYATCHWCHVMARESFSDPVVAAYLNENFVAVKVDREEHPDVDASFLAAAGAFTRNLGWPLSVFATGDARTFFAGTYFPPRPANGVPEFLRVLGAVTDAWTERRGELDATADAVRAAIAASMNPPGAPAAGVVDLDAAAAALVRQEDPVHGGFGTAPKFPVAPVLGFLLSGGGEGERSAAATLKAMGASALRDPVDGGFFRYATEADWTRPHYERMLYDNAILLDDYTTAWQLDPAGRPWAGIVAREIARFLLDVLQLPDGGFASAQDSESVIDGRRSEGGYYALDREARRRQTPPALDRKLLTGWNGLAIGALAAAGFAFDRPDWIAAARRAADRILTEHLHGRMLVRSSLDGRASTAPATLEDFGMLAGGLLRLAAATGDDRPAAAARRLVEATMAAAAGGAAFGVPGGADPVLVAHGIALAADPSEGAYPSGISACADAAYRLFLLTADDRYRQAAADALAAVAAPAAAMPIGFGGALGVLRRLAAPVTQLVTVVPDDDGSASGGSDASPAATALVAATRGSLAAVSAVVTDRQAERLAAAGFELFAGRASIDGSAAAYACTDFTCRLPVTDAARM